MKAMGSQCELGGRTVTDIVMTYSLVTVGSLVHSGNSSLNVYKLAKH